MTALIGRSVLRVEDERFLRGRGCYIDDLALDGMLHLGVVRSAVAHGVIRRIVSEPALRLPGVVAVLGCADIASPLQPIPMRIGQLPGLDRFMQRPIAQDKVRYVGEPVAVVVAETRYIAEDAVNLVEMEIDQLGAVVDWTTATQSGVLIHDALGTNVASSYRVEAGDVDGAFRAAEYTRRERMYVHRHTAIPMETRGLLADWDAARQRLTVRGATKVPFSNRRILAKMLDLPEKSIDMIEVDVGGGFGVRGEFYPEDFLVPYVAHALGRPIKWVEDRREHFAATNHSRDVMCDLEIACRRDGEILALRGEIFADIGAYARPTGGIVAANSARCLPGPYRIRNFACTVNAFVTNKTPSGTYRGPGQVESNFFSERMVDMAAADLGIDPADMRRRNLTPAAEMPSRRGKLVPYPEGETVYDSGDYPAALERALAEIGWRERQAEQGIEKDGWRCGVGIASFVSSSGVGPKETARVAVRADGAIEVHVGSSTLGQGHETVFAQICADSLNVPFEKIRVFHGSTTHLEEGFGTYHSRAIVMGGSAVVTAAQNLVEQLRPLAARHLGLPNTGIEWKEGRFVAEGVGSIGLVELAAASGGRIEADGVFLQDKRTYTYGTHAARVAVDPRTGRVKLLDYVAVEDIGKIMNPLLAHGQAVGSVVQGLGGVFLERLAYDESGQLLTGSLADYMMPTATDFPVIRCISLENAPSPSNPLGAKGAGEGGVVPVAGAVANAVSAALRPLAVEIRELPLTPPRVWSTIKQAAQ